jgi:hypothetical protein
MDMDVLPTTQLLRHGRKLLDDADPNHQHAPNIEDAENGGTKSFPDEHIVDHGHTTDAVYQMACARDTSLADILRSMVEEMDSLASLHSNFVIDFIPNHRELIQSKLFKQAGNVLARFDRSELHLRFAIRLEHDTTSRVQTPPPPSVTSDSDDAKSDRQKGSPSLMSSRDRLSTGNGSASALKHKKKSGDEHDKTKTTRRSHTISSMSEPFVTLFEASQRLMKIKCPELGATKMVCRFRSGMKSLGFKRRHGARRVYLALDGLNGRSGEHVGAITPEDLLSIPVCPPSTSSDTKNEDSGKGTTVRLLDVLDMLPRRFGNDGNDRSIVIDFENTLYSTEDCLQADRGIDHHPTIADPHIAEAAFEDPVPDVISFAIDSEIEVYLPKTVCTELCSAIVSRLAYQFRTS